jgi:hypothetical protein
MNNDLISRSALLELLRSLPYGYSDSFGGKYAIQAIEEAPTVPGSCVICCKECRFFIEYSKAYKREGVEADGDCYLRVVNTNNDALFCGVKKIDYCSMAERRNESVRLDKP